MTLRLDHLRRCTIAADLGAARTRVYLKHTGLIVDEPSVVAMNTRNGALIAVGAPAERMAGRTPANIRVVRPINGGTVVDIEMAQRMVRAMVGTKLRRAWRRRPLMRAAACIPHDADPLARRAALETLIGLGARRVELVDSLITAAIGCGLPVQHPEATMIIQCGAATTQVAVLSLGSIVAAEKVQMGGETIDRALIAHLRNQHELLLPNQAVRPLHTALASSADQVAEVHGRDVVTGLARMVRVDPECLRNAVMPPLVALLDAIRAVLHRCPPDLVADLVDRGVVLTGGAAVLPGLDSTIRESTGMPVSVATDPGLCAVRGLGALVEMGSRSATASDERAAGKAAARAAEKDGVQDAETSKAPGRRRNRKRAKPEPAPTRRPAAKADAQSPAEAGGRTTGKLSARATTPSEQQPETRSATKAETQPKPQPAARADARAGAGSEARPSTKADAQSPAEAGDRTTGKLSARATKTPSEQQPAGKAEARPAAGSEEKTQEKAEALSEEEAASKEAPAAPPSGSPSDTPDTAGGPDGKEPTTEPATEPSAA